MCRPAGQVPAAEAGVRSTVPGTLRHPRHPVPGKKNAARELGETPSLFGSGQGNLQSLKKARHPNPALQMKSQSRRISGISISEVRIYALISKCPKFS